MHDVLPSVPASQRSAKRGTQPASSRNLAAIQGAAEIKPQPLERPQRTNIAGLVALVWLCGCFVCLLRAAVIHLRLRGLVRRAAPVEAITLTSRLRWLCRDLGIAREVGILVSDEIDVPLAVGMLDPKIILSPDAVEWTDVRHHAVLCHELAHIKRWDALTQFLAALAAAIYWFHPLVWLTSRIMRNEREKACDDFVLAYGTPASDYAHELLEIVSHLQRPQPAAALAMARRSQLEGRLLALLNANVRHGMPTKQARFALIIGVIGLAIPVAATQLQERTSSSGAAPQAAVHAQPGDVIEKDTTGKVQGAIVGGIEGGVNGGVESAIHAGVGRGIGEGVGEVHTFDDASALGIPLYPGSTSFEHSDGRGTVSLIGGAQVQHLQASAYISNDAPSRVLEFYRERLKSYGQIIECTGGTNPNVDVELDKVSLSDLSTCRANSFAAGGTELKVGTAGDGRIVVALPRAAGSEIALVRYSHSSSAVADRDSFEYHHNRESDSNPVPFDCFGGKSARSTNISSHSENGNQTWTASWSGGECNVDVHSSGTIRFDADATAIESISPGGYFEVNERSGDNLRRLRVEPAANGQLIYTYKLNGTQQEFDSNARAWFSRFLLELERFSGFAVKTRVPALLSKGGPQAVLDEIAQLQSDYVRQIYFTTLFEDATLPGPMLVKALDQARSEISTDYSLAQVLLTIAQRYDLKDEAQRTAFLNGASKLQTDYEHSRVLLELLKRPNLSPQLVRAALESAKTINTDYEKSRILTTLAGLSTFDESEISTYLDLASTIHTDYEHSRSLMALIEHQKLSSNAVSQILKSATSISTDYEKSRILIALNSSSNFDEKQISTYLTLVDSIATDYERSRDLLALMQGRKLTNDSLARIIAEVQKIGTDYEKARVLTEVAQKYPIEGSIRDAYIKAANSISTEYDRNRTLAAVTKRDMT
jgi:beta-lactamase regulating signal transducer with metallopeptidase domain